MYEQPTGGHRIGPALIAVLVVLGGIAGTMSYLVARQIVGGSGNATVGQGQTSGALTTGPAATQPGTQQPGTQQPTTPAVTANPPDEGTFCPDLTEKAVTAAGLAAGLELRMYIEVTLSRGPARAWICQNSDGVLIYQAHERFGAFDRADNAVNTILVAKGIKGEVVADGDGFKAINPSSDGTGVTTYSVTKQFLTIEMQPSGKITKATVTRVVAP